MHTAASASGTHTAACSAIAFFPPRKNVQINYWKYQIHSIYSSKKFRTKTSKVESSSTTKIWEVNFVPPTVYGSGIFDGKFSKHFSEIFIVPSKFDGRFFSNHRKNKISNHTSRTFSSRCYTRLTSRKVQSLLVRIWKFVRGKKSW